ncbi:diguanylate cyclase [Methylophaga thiooxydans]|uniref:GGDEF domain-containing response regulator n=1 Tax=Methylophaga thiooxydans TaxID=392484 RepID=UPI002356AF15|nr:diguanylate cyclase [Methylophaga thiooxydans]
MRILIVDDNPTIRMTLEGLLKKHDCEIYEADSGFKALDIIQSDQPPELIFMDWNMPGLSGVEVTTLLRETVAENQPYVIIISSNSDSEHVIKALSYGADDYIVKPIDGRFLNAKFAVAQRILGIQEKLRQTNLVLEKLAYYDELTGVLNRRAGNASFQVEMDRAIRKGQNVCIAMVDIDHFKKINDTFGHQAGDEVLKAFSRVLRQTMRPYDIVCRYGGEEFMLIAEINNKDEASDLFERVRETISTKEIRHANQSISITASFGVHVFIPRTDMVLISLVQKADEALYEAKSAGRNKVIISANLNESKMTEPGGVTD